MRIADAGTVQRLCLNRVRRSGEWDDTRVWIDGDRIGSLHVEQAGDDDIGLDAAGDRATRSVLDIDATTGPTSFVVDVSPSSESEGRDALRALLDALDEPIRVDVWKDRGDAGRPAAPDVVLLLERGGCLRVREEKTWHHFCDATPSAPGSAGPVTKASATSPASAPAASTSATPAASARPAAPAPAASSPAAPSGSAAPAASPAPPKSP